MSDEHQVTTTIRIRYADCDIQGIVFNARWFELFDVAMTEFWRETIGGYDHIPRGFNLETVIAETGARFRGSARPDELLDFRVTPTRVGTSSLRMEIDAYRDDQILVEGFIEFVFVGAQSFEPAPIPDQVRNMLPATAASD